MNKDKTMRAAYLIAFAAMTAATSAHATCKNGGTDWPTCTTPTPTPQPVTPPAPSTSTNTLNNSSDASANAAAGAAAGAQAGASATGGNSTANGGSGGSMSYESFSKSNMYVLPAPVNAAPLPPGLCPQGDSLSWSIGWNFFSYARSSTRTELDCLDRVLASIKPVPMAQPTMAPMTDAERATLARLDRESTERATSATTSAPTQTCQAPAKRKAWIAKPAKVSGCKVKA